jgi:hypothetical protein
MAWTTPQLYETGDLIDVATLNAQLKGNLDVLGAHGHSGAAGNGAAALGALNTLTHGSISEPSAPDSGSILLWVDGTTLKVKNSAGTVTAISLEGHTH